MDTEDGRKKANERKQVYTFTDAGAITVSNIPGSVELRQSEKDVVVEIYGTGKKAATIRVYFMDGVVSVMGRLPEGDDIRIEVSNGGQFAPGSNINQVCIAGSSSTVSNVRQSICLNGGFSGITCSENIIISGNGRNKGEDGPTVIIHMPPGVPVEVKDISGKLIAGTVKNNIIASVRDAEIGCADNLHLTVNGGGWATAGEIINALKLDISGGGSVIVDNKRTIPFVEIKANTGGQATIRGPVDTAILLQAESGGAIRMASAQSVLSQEKNSGGQIRIIRIKN